MKSWSYVQSETHSMQRYCPCYLDSVLVKSCTSCNRVQFQALLPTRIPVLLKVFHITKILMVVGILVLTLNHFTWLRACEEYTKSRSHTHGKVQFNGNKWGELFKNDHCLIYFAKFYLLLHPPPPPAPICAKMAELSSAMGRVKAPKPPKPPSFIHAEFHASVSLFMPCAGDGGMALPQADGTSSRI